MEVSLPGEIVMSLKASLVIAEWTANDPVLSKVKKSLRHGWTLIDEQFEEHRQRIEELCQQGGCTLWYQNLDES